MRGRGNTVTAVTNYSRLHYKLLEHVPIICISFCASRAYNFNDITEAE